MSDQLIGFTFSAAWLWLILGTLFRIFIWLRARTDLSIVLAPAPTTNAGIARRLLLEILVFRSLWRASPITGIASLALHYGLLLILLMHLRFLFDTLPLWVVPFIQFSLWFALASALGIVVLLIRRVVIDRIRYVSSPSDYLHLLLLLAIVVSGSLLKRVWPTDLQAVGEFLRGTFHISWQPLPAHAGLMVHLLLVLLLLLVFPISKLVHGLGIVFTPTFVQKDRNGKSK